MKRMLKLAKFAQILGILNNTSNQLGPNFSRMKVYNAPVLHIFLHGSETWTLRKKDKKRLTSIEMKFFRTAGYTLFDHKGMNKFWIELKVEPVNEKLRRYKSNWLRHATRMNNSRMPKIMLNCKPNGHDDLEVL